MASPRPTPPRAALLLLIPHWQLEPPPPLHWGGRCSAVRTTPCPHTSSVIVITVTPWDIWLARVPGGMGRPLPAVPPTVPPALVPVLTANAAAGAMPRPSEGASAPRATAAAVSASPRRRASP